ncbi:putative transcription factor AS2-LOB family [Helianthus annuus]|uniref:Transcription factor AS2-LOB family n=1 Tax=Helianthus annuus TaxID=4232 RepID=A0A9K3HFJ3_HELAN|nr:putative transcription factor AS2-LOB family [Helianthus annuus]KAJ0862197.1 putative transcription factor AS2-LOB family [Helianthus annuus]
MSCNGCRVLRKGCEDDCILRPCLSWITSSESQANATLFLAKFYGRTGLLNLISAGPRHLRPGTIFFFFFVNLNIHGKMKTYTSCENLENLA